MIYFNFWYFYIMTSKTITLIMASLVTALSGNVMAEDEVQDMSDPLAVFTQVGAGMTNKGINLKAAKTYDTGSDITLGMRAVEIKGIGGELLGWDGSNSRDDSIDSFRFRDFTVDLVNGRGAQIDVTYDIEQERADLSYSFIQALPKFGPVQLYPLAGVGASVQNNAKNLDGTQENGYTMPGTFAVVGAYSKITITDKIWLNYNPMYMASLSGSDFYKSNAFGLGEGDQLFHEFAASYQFTPRFNIRYFANWNADNNFGEGDHRIEFNYQL